VKLQEIREKFLSPGFPNFDAQLRLEERGFPVTTAEELLDLWQFDTPAQVWQAAPKPPAPRKGLGLASSLELIDNQYVAGTLDLADATELWHEAGLSEDAIEDHLEVMDVCRKSHGMTWTAPFEAPDWIRQLSNLAKLYMTGQIGSWAALKQLDPKDEYPHVAGAILAHLIERRDSIAELAHDARNDPTTLDEGIEYCRSCGRARAARDLSNRGLCSTCRFTIQSRAVADLMNHSGPVYRKWRDAMLKAMYRLEDELREESMTDPEEPEPEHMNTYIARLKEPQP